MFFYTDEGFGIEMVQALDEPHAVDIVQALQRGAFAQAVPAASMVGTDKQQLVGLNGRPGAVHGVAPLRVV